MAKANSSMMHIYVKAVMRSHLGKHYFLVSYLTKIKQDLNLNRGGLSYFSADFILVTNHSVFQCEYNFYPFFILCLL